MQRHTHEALGRQTAFRERILPLRQRGVALAIVLWFIAGMSLLVAGIVSHAQVDTRMAQLHVARAKAVAAGDGAIHMMMADRYVNDENQADTAGVARGVYTLGSVQVSVALHPAAGLINLNSADANVLAALFMTVAKVPEGEANLLADNVLQWRGNSAGSRQGKASVNRFHAIEDLLRVEGMSRTLLDDLRDYIVAGQAGSTAETDWAKAPETLLRVLEIANPRELEAVNRRRESMSRSDAAREGRGTGLSGTYRADALVHYGDKTWLRRRWVEMSSAPASTLPWRMVRTEPPRVHEEPGGYL